MSRSEFDVAELKSGNQILVSGPFIESFTGEKSQILMPVSVHFMLVQHLPDSTSPPVTLVGVAVWDGSGSGWHETIDNDPPLVAGPVRGIGQMTVVKKVDHDPPVPPVYETITWCVNTTVR